MKMINLLEGWSLLNSNNLNKMFIYLFFRCSAYFEGDGNRRGYTFEEPGDLDLLIDEKMKEITEREVKQKEESNKEIVSKALDIIKKATT